MAALPAAVMVAVPMMPVAPMMPAMSIGGACKYNAADDHS